MLATMFGFQHLRRSRSTRVAAICLAYALAVQAVIAGIGAGMSAFAASDKAGFLICSQNSAPAPGSAGDRQKPSPPSCPFCFVAAQTAAHAALAGAVPAVPAYAALSLVADQGPVERDAYVPRFQRTTGDPRAPPVFSA